jgi:hypothetical protein
MAVLWRGDQCSPSLGPPAQRWVQRECGGFRAPDTGIGLLLRKPDPISTLLARPAEQLPNSSRLIVDRARLRITMIYFRSQNNP